MRLKGKKESENNKTNRPSKEGQRFLTVGSKQMLEPIKAGWLGADVAGAYNSQGSGGNEQEWKAMVPPPQWLHNSVFSRRSLSVEKEMGTCDWNGCSHSLLSLLESLA